MAPERVVRVRPRTVFAVLAIVLAVLGLLAIVWLARQVLTWVLVAVFLALAINPLVEWVQRRGIRRRGAAAAIAFLAVLVVVSALAGIFIPILITEVGDFIDALPRLVADLTEGRGRLGFLERDYQIVERTREAVSDLDPARVLTASGTALAVTKGVLTAVVAVITIVVLTLFMLLEGPGWVERGLALVPDSSRERWRAIAYDIYRTVGGYVSGALLIATIAGVTAAIVLSVAGVGYAIALGLLVALLDLIPLAGATIATVVVSTVAFIESSVTVGVVVLAFFVAYQQFENHLLYPIVYSRTVQLSALAILIAVLVGGSVGGILGALSAIPIAGVIQVLVRDWLGTRREATAAEAAGGASLRQPV